VWQMSYYSNVGTSQIQTFVDMVVRMSNAGAPKELNRSSPVPLWAQLSEELHRRIEVGDFEGEFPGEMFLVGEYQVSRNTVREAMRRLRDSGVVVAGRGRRPRVATPREIEQTLGGIYSLFASVEGLGLEQRSVVRALEIRTDSQAAAHLECAPDAPLFFLERLRLADGDPLALDRVWMSADLGAPLLDVDFTHTAFYDELLAQVGISLSGGREQLRAVVPEPHDRKLLRLGANRAALAIERIGYDNARPVEWRHTLVRGDRFSVVAEFSSRDGYQLDLADLAAVR